MSRLYSTFTQKNFALPGADGADYDFRVNVVDPAAIFAYMTFVSIAFGDSAREGIT